MTELSDELLVAYVGGDLADAQSAAVPKVLEPDAGLASRADALKEAHTRLEQAFDAILTGAAGDVMAQVPPMPQMPARQKQIGLVRIGIGVAFVGIALAALVAGLGWPLGGTGKSELKATAPTALAGAWQDRALAAQSLLSRASVEVSPESQTNEDLVALQLAKELGPTAKLPDLKAQGFKFMRGQLLSFHNRPLAQLLYLGAARPPLAVYAMKDQGEGAGISYREAGAIASLAWSEDGISYLLAGTEDEETLRRVADAMRKEQAPSLGAKPAAEISDPVVTGSN